MSQDSGRVVICGGGIIGASIAYHLALRGIACVVVERLAVACAASGKSGGFLALDWCDGSALGPLARMSYALHAELPARLGVDYGYRQVDTFGVAASALPGLIAQDERAESAWLDGECVVYGRLGSTATTAQVQPERFTHALMNAARERGASLVIGRVEGIDIDPRASRVRGVRVDGEVLPAERVVIAMGPWSELARAWLPLPPVAGLKGFSVRLKPARAVPAEALFVEHVDGAGARSSPEIYPRADGEVYVCGLSDDLPVPASPDEVEVSDASIERLKAMAGNVSSTLAGAEVVARGACYRPVCADGLPVMGEVPGVAGAYVATGHSCWGILNAPASG
ncbi:MAG: FAD-dependent oxidoreductase, partial [Gammaproteobacteria bacterium]|nr:FAD-dependent oxidoreductase [Gammaproteobacteria bacterium]